MPDVSITQLFPLPVACGDPDLLQSDHWSAVGYSRLQKVGIWAWDDLGWLSYFSRFWCWGTVIFLLCNFYCIIPEGPNGSFSELGSCFKVLMGSYLVHLVLKLPNEPLTRCLIPRLIMAPTWYMDHEPFKGHSNLKVKCNSHIGNLAGSLEARVRDSCKAHTSVMSFGACSKCPHGSNMWLLYTYTYMSVCIRIQHIYVYTHMYTGTHICIHIRKMCGYVYIYKYMCICMCIHIYI